MKSLPMKPEISVDINDMPLVIVAASKDLEFDETNFFDYEHDVHREDTTLRWLLDSSG